MYEKIFVYNNLEYKMKLYIIANYKGYLYSTYIINRYKSFTIFIKNILSHI